jgi:hypothetical protein
MGDNRGLGWQIYDARGLTFGRDQRAKNGKKEEGEKSEIPWTGLDGHGQEKWASGHIGGIFTVDSCRDFK